jgi:hypothetical protein
MMAPHVSADRTALCEHHLRQFLLPAILTFAALIAAPADAQAPTWAQAGMLRCRLNPSIGFVIFGHQSMECTPSLHAIVGENVEDLVGIAWYWPVIEGKHDFLRDIRADQGKAHGSFQGRRDYLDNF